MQPQPQGQQEPQLRYNTNLKAEVQVGRLCACLCARARVGEGQPGRGLRSRGERGSLVVPNAAFGSRVPSHVRACGRGSVQRAMRRSRLIPCTQTNNADPLRDRAPRQDAHHGVAEGHGRRPGGDQPQHRHRVQGGFAWGCCAQVRGMGLWRGQAWWWCKLKLQGPITRTACSHHSSRGALHR